MPPRAATATGCGISCWITRRARTAFTAGCFPDTSTEVPRRKPVAAGSRRTVSLLLLGRIGWSLSVQQVFVRDLQRLAVRSCGQTNLVGHFTHTMIDFFNRVGIDLLQGHVGVSRITLDRIFLAVEFRLITLTVPVHAEMLGCHLVGDGA